MACTLFLHVVLACVLAAEVPLIQQDAAQFEGRVGSGQVLLLMLSSVAGLCYGLTRQVCTSPESCSEDFQKTGPASGGFG